MLMDMAADFHDFMVEFSTQGRYDLFQVVHAAGKYRTKLREYCLPVLNCRIKEELTEVKL
jgi:hypothetical protein